MEVCNAWDNRAVDISSKSLNDTDVVVGVDESQAIQKTHP